MAGAPGGATSTASASVSLTGLQAWAWQITKCASALMVFLPASVAETGMSNRALSAVLAARSARVSFAFCTDSPLAGVSATLMGASPLTCQPPLTLMVRLVVAVPPTGTLRSVFVIS